MSSSLLIVVGLLMALLFLGSPVIFAIGFAALAYFFIAPGMLSLLSIFAHKFYTGMDVFIWLSIPLFIIAGEIMTATNMTERLLNFSRLLVGRMRGGLAYVNVVGSMLFGGVSGSALADIAALGPVEIDMMKRDGYKPDFAAALTVSSAIQGPIIPPQHSAYYFLQPHQHFGRGAVPRRCGSGHPDWRLAHAGRFCDVTPPRISSQPDRRAERTARRQNRVRRILGVVHARHHYWRHRLGRIYRH